MTLQPTTKKKEQGKFIVKMKLEPTRNNVQSKYPTPMQNSPGAPIINSSNLQQRRGHGVSLKLRPISALLDD